MKRSLKNLRFHQGVENDRIKVIRQPGGRLVYDWDEFDDLTYYILDTFVDPPKRRKGIAKKMLETLFRRANRDGAMISTGIFLPDGKHLIPTLKSLGKGYAAHFKKKLRPVFHSQEAGGLCRRRLSGPGRLHLQKRASLRLYAPTL